LSGSGPSALLLVPDDGPAEALAAAVRPRVLQLDADAAVRVAHGPVAGAAVVDEAG